MPPPETDANSFHLPSHQTIQERYDALTSPSDAWLLGERGRRRADTRLQREPQKVKIEEMQSKDDPRSISGGSSPLRLKLVTRANAQRIRRDEKEAKSS